MDKRNKAVIMILRVYMFSKKSIDLKKITKQIRQVKKRITVIIFFVLVKFSVNEISVCTSDKPGTLKPLRSAMPILLLFSLLYLFCPDSQL